MASVLQDLDIHVLQPPIQQPALETFASIFRSLRLQSLRESPESFTDKYDEVAARSDSYWPTFIQMHKGLIHIAFGVSKAEGSIITRAEPRWRSDLIMAHGKPLGMAVNTGPVPSEHFLSLPGSRVPPNRPDCEEQRFHGGSLFHIPEVRGDRRLFAHLVLSRDQWLLSSLLSAQSDPPPVARFRGDVKSGRHQKRLLEFYDRAGWQIAGTQTSRTNKLALGGPAAVQEAELRGDDMDEVSVVVEKIFTVSHLEWEIRESRKKLGRDAARL